MSRIKESELVISDDVGRNSSILHLDRLDRELCLSYQGNQKIQSHGKLAYGAEKRPRSPRQDDAGLTSFNTAPPDPPWFVSRWYSPWRGFQTVPKCRVWTQGLRTPWRRRKQQERDINQEIFLFRASSFDLHSYQKRNKETGWKIKALQRCDDGASELMKLREQPEDLTVHIMIRQTLQHAYQIVKKVKSPKLFSAFSIYFFQILLTLWRCLHSQPPAKCFIAFKTNTGHP